MKLIPVSNFAKFFDITDGFFEIAFLCLIHDLNEAAFSPKVTARLPNRTEQRKRKACVGRKRIVTNLKQVLTKAQAKRLWIRSQKLDQPTPFGSGPAATQAAIEHLGYVQIDTISVIERCHHHILFNRIPRYQRSDLNACQSLNKSVFECWTHALSYVPTRDYRFFMRQMKARLKDPGSWLADVSTEDMRKVLRLIQTSGALSIRDFEDDVLVEKSHPWASRKPSKKALQLGFMTGQLIISERVGMLKNYELTDRHFDWDKKPKAATENEICDYQLDRAIRAQGLVSLDSICHLDAKNKKTIHSQIELRLKKEVLIPVQIEGLTKTSYWMQPHDLDSTLSQEPEHDLVHLLSPFDPLIIQRKRLQVIFGYEHLFEAYIPKEKRIHGYFGIPVLMNDRIVAVLDLKTDRALQKLQVKKWIWTEKSKSTAAKKRIEEELHRFEKFQLGTR